MARHEKGARGTGWIYLRGKTYWCQYDDRGHPIRKSTGATTARAAQAFLRKQLAALDEGRHHAGADRVTFSRLAELVRRDYVLNRRRSVARLDFALAHLRDYFVGMKALDMRPSDYAAHRAKEKAAPATIKRELAVLRRAFALAVEDGSLARVPAMPRIAVDNARTGYFERADLDALLAQLPVPLRAPITFAYLTGWRMASEILPLKWAQVDLDAGYVRLEPGSTKTGQGREFPVHALPELHALLVAQRAATPTDCRWVFNRNGERIKSIRTAWTLAVKRANLVGRNPHDFRRTAVRNLQRFGVSDSVSQKLVGHKSNAMHMRYAMTSGSDIAEGVAKLARGHAAAAPAPKVAQDAAKQGV